MRLTAKGTAAVLFTPVIVGGENATFPNPILPGFRKTCAFSAALQEEHV